MTLGVLKGVCICGMGYDVLSYANVSVSLVLDIVSFVGSCGCLGYTRLIPFVVPGPGKSTLGSLGRGLGS